jgi:hypothetical protein
MTKTGLVIERNKGGEPQLLLVDEVYATVRVWKDPEVFTDGTKSEGGDGVLFLITPNRERYAFQSMEDLGDMVIMKDCVEI